MKSIAVFLILNILLLSSITGTANIYYGKAACAASKIMIAQKEIAMSCCPVVLAVLS
jgi:hypothetical protein